MNGWTRGILIMVSLVPYVYFGFRDLLHHKEHRKIPLGERLLHLTLGTLLIAIVPHACQGHWDVVIPGVVLFTLTRSIDEFVFHRALAPAEVDLHAKTHLGFLIFVVGVIGVGWLDEQKLWP
jgi:hypothetical protein